MPRASFPNGERLVNKGSLSSITVRPYNVSSRPAASTDRVYERSLGSVKFGATCGLLETNATASDFFQSNMTFAAEDASALASVSLSVEVSLIEELRMFPQNSKCCAYCFVLLHCPIAVFD